MRSRRELERRYVALTAEERVRLAVSALARADEREYALVQASSPKQRYIGCEWAHERAMEELSGFTTFFAALQIAPRAARLTLLQDLQRAADLAVAAAAGEASEEISDVVLAEAAALSADDIEFFACVARPLSILEGLVHAEAAALAHGFAVFCAHELGLEARELLRAFARPFVAEFELLAAGRPDADAVAAHHDLIACCWQEWRAARRVAAGGGGL